MSERPAVDERRVDVLVVGAGFAGMYMLHRSRELGLTTRVFEAGTDVGGTWYWNRYPGARCDVESMEYSYQFDEALQQEWEWSERYAGQPEILRYANHVADRFGLRPDIRFETRVTAAVFDGASDSWTVTVLPEPEDGGSEDDREETWSARFLVMATGCLSSANTPTIPGLDTFSGPVYHTGRWPHEGVDFNGRRVAVIGTGSSGIQAIPIIAGEAAQLTVFQRTANYSVPARNRPLEQAEVDEIKADYPDFRARNSLQPAAFGSKITRRDESALAPDDTEREKVFEERWEDGGFSFMGSFNDLMLDNDANDLAADFVRSQIHQIVDDPDVAERLSPKQVIGCKRLCLDTNYYETFNRRNVELVDISDGGVDEVTPTGIRVGDTTYQVDCIVCATGFDAMTGTLLRIDIRGRDGLTIQEKWSAGPLTYLGLGIAGFPNLFTVSGPGSPSVLTNMIVSIEQHVNWIADCMAYLGRRGLRTIEATAEAEADWVGHVNTVADATLYPQCNSWYLGSNVPGKTRVFMPLIGFPPYVERCNRVAADGYAGFALA